MLLNAKLSSHTKVPELWNWNTNDKRSCINDSPHVPKHTINSTNNDTYTRMVRPRSVADLTKTILFPLMLNSGMTNDLSVCESIIHLELEGLLQLSILGKSRLI